MSGILSKSISKGEKTGSQDNDQSNREMAQHGEMGKTALPNSVMVVQTAQRDMWPAFRSHLSAECKAGV
jgi:hypothetical protein